MEMVVEVLDDELTQKSKVSEIGVQKKAKYVTKISENTTPFNMVEELNQFYPKISFTQLLEASPTLTAELNTLCKKVKKLDVNEIRVLPQKISNCKVIVSDFNKKYWAVVDTGAACSVTTTTLAEQWGIEPDEWQRQVIVTADGSRHSTCGILNRVPQKISNYTLEAELVIMNRKDDMLILGTDWLYRHHGIVDPRSSELKIQAQLNLLIITMQTISEKPQQNTYDSEIYLMVKGDDKEKSTVEKYDDERLTKFKEEFKDIFVDDINELTQTDLAEHRIELNDETPIKQRPYRIPHHMQLKVRIELEIMERKGVISPCYSE
ncbi:hypothetical protein AX774_g2772 [Zancudomyces culisetae]|uniref:DNA damage-inducible protein 1 n=1 Tax=Zancudomyces culisetae TaxID=1213189 RepID=A0A1R1PRY9_ZANCU|nr:hypothetical protein AX774_g2772 [Zancudomyces culisetae]|eukprot:OMH83718.1 hypothetical protein AX774_g2772 [Zancudomyces culisetae]